jgi:hypothetical protein
MASYLRTITSQAGQQRCPSRYVIMASLACFIRTAAFVIQSKWEVFPIQDAWHLGGLHAGWYSDTERAFRCMR